MALNPREKMLALIAGPLMAVVVAWYGLSFFTGPTAALRTQRTNLETEVRQKRARVDKAAKSYRQQRRRETLAMWKRGTLDRDPEIAGLDYQNWLLGLCEGVGLKGATVVSNPLRKRGDLYIALPFTVTGQGNLKALTDFLHKFYADDRLQQIRRVVVKPIEDSSDLELTITVEAVSLQQEALAAIDAFQEVLDQRDEGQARAAPSQGESIAPPAGTSRWLAEVALDLEEYRKRIVGRNLFAPYTPPRTRVTRTEERPRQPDPPSFDPSKYAFVNAIVEVDGKPQVWLKARTTDEKFELCEGDTFQLGPLRGTIGRIGWHDVEIEINGKRHLVALGDSLHEAIELPEP